MEKENTPVTSSVRFQDAEFTKTDATPSFLRELEESKSFVDNEYDEGGGGGGGAAFLNILGGGTNPGGGVGTGPEAMSEHVDVPERVTQSYGAKNVVEEMQRFSIAVGTQIANGTRCSERLEGQLYVKGRGIFGKWSKMFASVAKHSNFGPVLFLFKYDNRGRMRVKDSLMILLSSADVQEGRTIKGNSAFKIKTEKKKWLFACRDVTVRDHWLKELQLMAAM